MRRGLLKAALSAGALILAAAAGTLSASTTTPGPIDPNIFVVLAKRSVPSVVNISTVSSARPDWRMVLPWGRGGPDDEGDDEGRGPEAGPMPGPGGQVPRATSLGTGFIIDASGLILTNNHVVADADEIKVWFTEELDEKPTDGEVVGRDPELDLALIRVKSKRALVALPLGDSDALEVGEYVMAVGNPFGQGHSVTHGIISAKGRKAPDFDLGNYLQTDAPINPGNSGGPLVNLKGEVVGINNAIDARAQGIGFAIPINLAKAVLPQLKSKGTVSRGYIGVLVNEMTPEFAVKLGAPKDLKAPFITHVYPGDPAEKSGLKPYDVILELNRKRIRNSQELVEAVIALPVGATVPVKVSRAGETQEIQLKVGQRPSGPLSREEARKKARKHKRPSRVDAGLDLEDMSEELARDLALPSDAKGAVVVNLAYGGPAEKAGLYRGDLIVEVDRKPVRDADGFWAIVKEKKTYLLRIRRPDPQGHDAYLVLLLDLTKAK